MGSTLSATKVFTQVDADSERVWHVAYTQPRREQVALENLQQQGFDAYLPLYKTYKKSGRSAPGAANDSAESIAAYEPMFPRYVFFRPGHAGHSISGARSTRGVSFVLTTGVNSAVLKPHELRAIQACEQARNAAGADQISPFQPGLQVRLRECGLRGLEGLVKSVTARRVTLLLELLGRPKLVSVGHHQLELAN